MIKMTQNNSSCGFPYAEIEMDLFRLQVPMIYSKYVDIETFNNIKREWLQKFRDELDDAYIKYINDNITKKE